MDFTKELAALATLLQDKKNILITTHTNPDGDAMGSSLGLYHYLLQKKHKVAVVVPNAAPEFLAFLPGSDEVLNFETHRRKAQQIIDKADLIFTLDFNNLKRLDELGTAIMEATATKIMVDHHIAPDTYATITFSDVKACSTCQLIYEIIAGLGDIKMLNKDIADCLYTGIMTDTGSFKFESTTAATHRIVADLVEAGAAKTFIHGQVYDTNTEERMRLVGYALLEKLTVFPDHKTAFIALTADELQRFNFRKGDTEGLVNYALSLFNVRFAAFFMERDEIIKISFRSKGGFDVNTFARKHFNGGGHFNAAGASSELNMDETLLRFTSLLNDYKKELNA